MVTNTITFLLVSDVFQLFLNPVYYITSVMFLFSVFLTVVEGFVFSSPSIIITYKTLESILAFLGFDCSKVVLCFSIGCCFFTSLLWIVEWDVIIIIVYFLNLLVLVKGCLVNGFVLYVILIGSIIIENNPPRIDIFP